MPMLAGSYEFSSRFGMRPGGMHRGVDFAAMEKTKIFAAQAGSVVFIGRADGFGQWIVIDHPAEAGGGTTVYGHMWDAHATGLRNGDRVHAGQHIAFVGNNGQSTGAHLHFEVHPTVWRAGSQIDPLPWLAGASEPDTATAQHVGEATMPKSDHDMLCEIYALLTAPLPSRSIYRSNDQPVDTWRGMLLNVDGMAHEAYIEREALLGYQPAVELVRRCADHSVDGVARERAAFILDKIDRPERTAGTDSTPVDQQVSATTAKKKPRATRKATR
ncbi:M23 family metallopeptidase [Mycolicibacterium psychrotolerans]|nr:M23 family metallopeptidase [Mycolicibacterium psychrotolerans]